MLPNAFIGKAEKPSDEELAAELGRRAKTLWDQLLSELADQHNINIAEWHSYSRKAGWALRLKLRDRTIVYLSPCKGSFRASFALGDKAVAAARASKLPKKILSIIAEAKKYAEGTAVRFDVEDAKDVAAVTVLAALKLQH
ncbi:MAG TPA: DUF3788 domain-containing protein [Bryobacteraceae bacterium]|nr:DUF3788 domain-containing protein [Bryobacteraceae bacterium]